MPTKTKLSLTLDVKNLLLDKELKNEDKVELVAKIFYDQAKEEMRNKLLNN